MEKNKYSNKCYTITADLRMTCEKTDPRNICSDIDRSDGFYWSRTHSEIADENEENEQTRIAINECIQQISLLNVVNIAELQERIERIPIPDGCEAMLIRLTIYLPGSTGCNGGNRRNVTFESFRDLRETKD